jgi:hypothetical protein
LIVDYTDFCEDPSSIYKVISEKYKKFAELLTPPTDKGPQYSVRFVNRLTEKDSRRLHEALVNWEAKLQADHHV